MQPMERQNYYCKEMVRRTLGSYMRSILGWNAMRKACQPGFTGNFMVSIGKIML
jgi:hypothetical protein